MFIHFQFAIRPCCINQVHRRELEETRKNGPGNNSRGLESDSAEEDSSGDEEQRGIGRKIEEKDVTLANGSEEEAGEVGDLKLEKVLMEEEHRGGWMQAVLNVGAEDAQDDGANKEQEDQSKSSFSDLSSIVGDEVDMCPTRPKAKSLVLDRVDFFEEVAGESKALKTKKVPSNLRTASQPKSANSKKKVSARRTMAKSQKVSPKSGSKTVRSRTGASPEVTAELTEEQKAREERYKTIKREKRVREAKLAENKKKMLDLERKLAEDQLQKRIHRVKGRQRSNPNDTHTSPSPD